MDFKLTKLMAIVVLLGLAFTCYAEDEREPNKTAIETKVDSSAKRSEVELTTEPLPEEDNSSEQIEAKLAKEYYKDCVQNLKWALNIIIALVVGSIGYAIFKSRREYREALEDVREALKDSREACREARGASDKAREYEEKAQESLSGIDKEVASKLKEIEEKGTVLIKDLIKEAEEQRAVNRAEAEKERKASELFSLGLRAAEAKDFESATKYFAATVEVKPEDHVAYGNWGAALIELADRKEGGEREELLAQTLEKFKKAVEIKSDYYLAYTNWGTALSELAKRKEGNKQRQLLTESKEKCLKAESIKKGEGSYNLACVYALLGNEKECKRWLKTGDEAGTLPRHSHAMSDSDLESVREKEWFKQLRWADDVK